MASDSINHFIESDLADHNIGYQQCPKHADNKSPNSYIILNSQCGSRTILHTNLGLPELQLKDFQVINICDYSWMHFEGRPNVEEIRKMMQKVHDFCKLDKENKPLKMSLEIEKLNRNYEPLLPLADVIFVSKEYALSQGFQDMTSLVSGFHREKLDDKAVLICAWGDKGAAGKDANGDIVQVSAFPPSNGVIDTIGAGDTFNATVVACLSQGKTLKAALEIGCKVAGAKVGQRGFKGLKDVYKSEFSECH